MSDQEKGLYRKYNVERLNDPTGKHADCTYYVLDLNHDKFAVPALEAYAAACAEDYPTLAFDLRHTAAATARKLNYAPPSSIAAREPDGYAVLLDDKTSAPNGFWFIGCYITKETADAVATKGKQGARVVPIYFARDK